MGKEYTKAQAAATKKYLQNIGEYKLRVAKDKKTEYMNYAKSKGKSLNELIIELLDREIERG